MVQAVYGADHDLGGEFGVAGIESKGLGLLELVQRGLVVGGCPAQVPALLPGGDAGGAEVVDLLLGQRPCVRLP
ncbi:MAG: hypothetical protein NT029_13425 [Armatimonadetes bacterium]|nr:hypothetical protein [Armatimonadota bacterium]